MNTIKNIFKNTMEILKILASLLLFVTIFMSVLTGPLWLMAVSKSINDSIKNDIEVAEVNIKDIGNTIKDKDITKCVYDYTVFKNWTLQLNDERVLEISFIDSDSTEKTVSYNLYNTDIGVERIISPDDKYHIFIEDKDILLYMPYSDSTFDATRTSKQYASK